jgi:Ala-tRNA(Pro) deacylase
LDETYTKFIEYLSEYEVPYRLIDHEPEGRTEVVSEMRGNELSQAAKCILLMVKIGKKVTKYVLAVVPGDKRVDLNAVKALMGGTYAAFADRVVAERLSGSVAGTILPFSFDPALELVVDPALLESDNIYFNAARLDRSMVLRSEDYVALAKPRIAPIAERPVSYSMHLDTLFSPLQTVDLQPLIDKVKEPWYNQTLCRVNDCVVRLGVVRGEFHWHKHEDEDEFFYVVEGRLVIDLEDGEPAELGPRQGITIPKGVLHRPRAAERTVILMIEGAGVIPRGD